MITIEQLDKELRKIDFKICGRHPNRWIVAPENKRTSYRVFDDRLEYEEPNRTLDHYVVTCFYFKDLDLELLDDNAVSVNGNKDVFILFGNHKLPSKKASKQ